MLKNIFGSPKNDPFNQATQYYRNIRNLASGTAEYKKHIFEIIRLCQQAIQTNKQDGDAHVLLANAYSMAALDCIASEGFKFFLRRSVAVIQTTKIKGFYVKNRQIADSVYLQINNLISSQEDYRSDVTHPSDFDLLELTKRFYDDAINPSYLIEMIALHDECNISR